MLLLPEGQMDEAWKLSEKQCFLGNQEDLTERYVAVFLIKKLY
jgi:hypothetical protein